jgi:hypothetical protein
MSLRAMASNAAALARRAATEAESFIGDEDDPAHWQVWYASEVAQHAAAALRYLEIPSAPTLPADDLATLREFAAMPDAAPPLLELAGDLRRLAAIWEKLADAVTS